MSYFDPAKFTTSGVNFIEEQRARYDAIVKAVKIVAIVGIMVRPRDKHIWEGLAATNAEVIYCSGKAAGQEFVQWADDKRRRKASRVLNTYFSEGFEDLCTSIGLIGTTK